MASPPKKIIDETRVLDDASISYRPVTGGTFSFSIAFLADNGVTVTSLGAASVKTSLDSSLPNLLTAVSKISLAVTGGTFSTGSNPDPRLLFLGEGFKVATRSGSATFTDLTYSHGVISANVSVIGGFSTLPQNSRADVFTVDTVKGVLYTTSDYVKALGVEGAITTSGAQSDFSFNASFAKYTAGWDLAQLKPYEPAGAIPIQPTTFAKPTPVLGGLTTITLNNAKLLPTLKYQVFNDTVPGPVVIDKTAATDTIRMTELYGTGISTGTVLYHGGGFRLAADSSATSDQINFRDLVVDTRTNLVSGFFGVATSKTDLGGTFVDIFKIGANGSLTFSDYAVNLLDSAYGAGLASTTTVLGSIKLAPVFTQPSDSAALAIHKAYTG